MRKVREFTTAPDVVTVGVVHDLNLAAQFADQVVLLDQGKVISVGTASEVLTVDNIRRAFKVTTTFVPVKSGFHLVFE